MNMRNRNEKAPKDIGVMMTTTVAMIYRLRSVLVTAVIAAALFLALGGDEPASAVPANDSFANAIAVTTPSTGDIVAVADTSGATTEAGESTFCALMGSTVWYSWTSPASPGTVVFDTYGSDFNTVMAVYIGATLPTLAIQNCNDNFGATRSGVMLSYTASTTYYIQVGGSSGATGNLVLNMAAGATMLVDSIGNLNAADNSLNLVEAMLLAKSGTATTGLNRNLTLAESAAVLNPGEAGASGADIIHFSPTVFPSNTPATIGLVGSLPPIDYGFDNVSGIGAGVIVDGGNGGFTCFSLDGADNSIIEGLEIRRCSKGVALSNNADNNRIGGSVIAAQRNTIRENTEMGVEIAGNGNAVWGNRIGTDKTGLYDMGNAGGVYVLYGQANQIGGPAPLQGNIISGNGSGVITGPFASTTDIEANYIGVGVDGLLPLGNDNAGVSLSGSGESVDNNLISANDIGISLASQGAFVRSNHIGTDATGRFAVGNDTGVQVNTGDNNFIGQGALGNVISGNVGNGVWLMSDAWGNFVSGNRIGVDAEGDDWLGNGGIGVFIANDASSNAVGANFPSSRNIISGNQQDGVQILGGAGAQGSMTSFATSTPIPNPGTASSDISVLRHGVVTDVEVTVNSITHPVVGNLNLSLKAPNGDVIYLSTLNGGGGDNYSYTKFDDEAATSITAAAAPFTGTFRPEEVLADLDGIDPYGAWTLSVADVFVADGPGTLGAWTLHLTTQGNSVQGNYIGPDVNGTTNFANWGNGVRVGGIGNLIGGSEAAARNVISGNAGSGIAMEGGPANARTYSTNTFVAISDLSTVNSTITVPNEAKVTDVNVQLNISHTHDADLDIRVIAPDATQVELSTDNGGSGDNYSTTVFDDEAATAITAGAAPFIGSFRPEGKLRSLDGKDAGGVWTLQVTDDALFDGGNLQWWSITLTLAGNTVQGNYIGTDASGGASLSNQFGGIVLGDLASGNLIGGDAAGAGNLISGNGGDGISIGGTAESNKIQGNLIGTDAAGNIDLGNVETGVELYSAGNLIGGMTVGARNVISGNQFGIWLQDAGATGNTVQGNFIGTNAAGNADLGANGNGITINNADGNLIGGTAAGARNLISGNTVYGIALGATSTGNLVQGNLIGTNVAGTATIANGSHGVYLIGAPGNVIGGAAAGAGNVIGGNGGNGIELVTSGNGNNVIQGNFIGTDSAGILDLGNAGDGVDVSNGATPTTVGGAAPGAGNRIAFNGGDGVQLTSDQANLYPTQVAIRGNRIYKNDGLGINLGSDGVTPNDSAPDSDPGFNQLQNFPVLTGVYVDTVLDMTTIDGTIESAFSTFYTLDFYYSVECDASGNGEGEVYLGSGGTTTNALGIGSFSMQWDVEIPAGTFITATATDPNGNTSEFSNCVSAFNDGDDDNDGYTDANESLIGTNPSDPCGHDGWPSNPWDASPSDNRFDVQDILSFVAPVRRLDTSPGLFSAFHPRWDLAPGPNAPFLSFINIIDLTTMLNGSAGSPAYPPMFNGQRAYLKDCPFSP
jgi:subtilisin-like proprotein convertase family protein